MFPLGRNRVRLIQVSSIAHVIISLYKATPVIISLYKATNVIISLYKATNVIIIVFTKPPDVNLPHLRTFLLIKGLPFAPVSRSGVDD
jgi:hypothetical protein